MAAPGVDRKLFVGFARAFGGALLFAIPSIMTMELWWLGFHMERLRLLLLTLLLLPVLVGLSWYCGFEPTTRLLEDVVDAFVAYAVGCAAAASLLLLLSVVTPPMSLVEMAGKLIIVTIPASLGALLAESELGVRDETEERKRDHAGFFGELFLMGIGSLILSFHLAPTEEVYLVAHMIDEKRTLLLMLFSIVLMHAFVYAVEFRGQHAREADSSHWSIFARYTMVGYALVLLMSYLMLWSFGRMEGLPAVERLEAVAVLSFPGALGAASARLIL